MERGIRSIDMGEMQPSGKKCMIVELICERSYSKYVTMLTEAACHIVHPEDTIISWVLMAEEVHIMHNLRYSRQEHGAALVVSLLLLAVLLLVGSGALTTSRIETQVAGNDEKVKQALLSAEYALALGEST